MRKKDAVLISFFVTIICVGNFLFFYDFNEGREDVVISRVLDGDTVKLEDGRTIRLLNINAPEKGRPNSQEATNFLLPYQNKSVQMQANGVGIYGRVLGRLYSGSYLNLEIIKEGLAHKYLVEENELEEFKKAEDKARENELGIWKKSDFYGCLDVETNKYDEYLAIEINCEVDLKGWTVKDESTKQYVFKKDFGDSVILYSGKGKDGSNEVYWGQGKVWNDDKDSVFIRDDEGFLVFYYSYGY